MKFPLASVRADATVVADRASMRAATSGAPDTLWTLPLIVQQMGTGGGGNGKMTPYRGVRTNRSRGGCSFVVFRRAVPVPARGDLPRPARRGASAPGVAFLSA
jgi:hypothetical protein